MLSKAFLTYKDNVVFIPLLIIYFLLCIMQWPIHWHNYYLLSNILGNIYFHQSLWKLELKWTKQTEVWKARTAAGLTLRSRPDRMTLVCQSWFPTFWGAFFFWNPPQKGLEGKNQTFRVSRGLQEEERKEEIYLYRKRSSNIYIYKGRGIKLAFFFAICVFFGSGLGSLLFSCFSSSFHQCSNCFR